MPAPSRCARKSRSDARRRAPPSARIRWASTRRRWRKWASRSFRRPSTNSTLVSTAIALIKANRLDEAEAIFQTAAARLIERGAEIIILGCTEIPIGMQRQYRANPERFVDSTEALAAAVIEYFSDTLCNRLN